MKFFSFEKLFENFKNTILRFQFVSMFSLIGTFIGISLIHFDFDPNADYTYFYNLLITCVLGFIIFISIQTFGERNKLDFKKHLALKALGLIFLVSYFHLLPNTWSNAYAKEIIRVILYSISFLFSVTFAPFLVKGEINGFWQFNKTLIIRLFFSILYAVVLFIGVTLAYTAAEQLLNVNISYKLYPETFAFIVGVLASHFFISGIPKDFEKLEKETEYPKGIKFFAQYILIPLITTYAVILSIYVAKILINGEWPKGTVSWLILLFSIGGIITNVLLYPLNNIKISWIKYFSKIFFLLDLIFIPVLFTAIHIRLKEYGLTEPRYYLLLLGIWLAIMGIYFLFSKKQNIKIIPISLFIIILFSSFGPWGAISMSENNQVKRLEKALIENEILFEGKIIKIEKEIDIKERRKISGILEYLEGIHGYEKINKWFDKNLSEYVEKERIKRDNAIDLGAETCWNDYCFIMKNLMGIDYITMWDYNGFENNKEVKFFSYTTNHNIIKDVLGYNYFFNIGISSNENFIINKQEFTINGRKYILHINNKNILVINNNNVIAEISLQSLIEKLQKKYINEESNIVNGDKTVPVDDMTIFSEDKNIKIEISNLGIKNREEKLKIEYLNADIFLKQ